MKALSAKIFSNKLFSGCSNGGISSRFDEVLIEHPNGHIEISGDEENLCKVVRRKIYGKTVFCLKPAENPGAWYMFGGSFVNSSDSRFSELFDDLYGAIALHDRRE